MASSPATTATSIHDDGSVDDDNDSAAGDLQKFYENDVNVKPADKVPFMITLCFAYVEGFSTDIAPYNDKTFKHSKKNHKISNAFLKVEIKRKDSTSKLSNKKQNDLLEMLKSNPLPAKDMDFLKWTESAYEAKCQATIDENTEAVAASAPAPADRGPSMTLDDRFCLIEALLSDKAKEKLSASQDCLTRAELDARNSVLSVEDYFETVSKVFNDPTWVPTLSTCPELHPQLAHTRELPLKEYRTPTQDRKQQKQPILACHLAECALWSPRVVKMTAYVVEWAPSFFIFLLWLKAMPMIESKATWVLI